MTAVRVIEVLKFGSGERYPVLLGIGGLPDWYPTLFITTQARNAGNAYNTIKAKLGAIRMALNWSELTGLSMVDRFRTRRWLSSQEIESLYEYTQRQFRDGTVVAVEMSSRHRKKANLVISTPRVNSDSHYVRLTYAAKYIGWLATNIREQNGGMSDGDRKEISNMQSLIEAHRPIKRSESRIYAEEGLDEGQLKLLLEITRPESEQNPFRDDVRCRNELIVRLFIALGPRAGEILKIKTTDFNFQTNEVLVGKQRDDPSDERINEPVPKTLDRRLPLDCTLIQRAYDYIFYERRRFPAAKSHSFLLVTHQQGKFQGHALSQRGLNKIFEQIRHAQSKFLGDVHPHTLRHTSNDLFSKMADKEQMPEAREEQLRSYKYGWRFGSGTAARYNKRHIERQAKEASLKLQEQLREKGSAKRKKDAVDEKE